MGFPGGWGGKEPACNVGDPGLIPVSGRSPGEGHGYPLQCSSRGNPTDRGVWWATVHGVEKSIKSSLSMLNTYLRKCYWSKNWLRCCSCCAGQVRPTICPGKRLYYGEKPARLREK